MNGANMAMGFDRSETGPIEWNLTEDETSEALHSRIAATTSIPLNYGELCDRNKKLHRDDLDEIINNISATMAKFYLARINPAAADKTTADFQLTSRLRLLLSLAKLLLISMSSTPTRAMASVSQPAGNTAIPSGSPFYWTQPHVKDYVIKT